MAVAVLLDADGAEHASTFAGIFVAAVVGFGGPEILRVLVATLAAADWAEFAFLKEELGLSDSALSKQLATLDEAGYVGTADDHATTRETHD